MTDSITMTDDVFTCELEEVDDITCELSEVDDITCELESI